MKSRVVEVGGQCVLKENNYTMQQGGISVMQTSQSHIGSMARLHSLPRASRV